ncbi:hypothetical protein SAMN04487996_112256 [Dyadobacter soli]|uniref:Uncharacterized protein n=1 Tax=Dyadobacter soli TaxID=659014 RepID=A0A1G7P4H2_9BACT|nr:hypothetical protein [Dyadobacter soli]SDF81216.1 hypothetical protein SAMN04487996_112256 [Dyadobacter soli]
MKKLLKIFFGVIVCACDADRTELPRPSDQEIPSQKLNGSLYEKVVLEVTLTRPIAGLSDSTYVNIKNVSGKAITILDFYLESCQKADSDIGDCVPDYHFTLKTDSLKKDEIVIDKIKRFVDFGYSNKLYITAFKPGDTTPFSFPSRYPYSTVQKVVTAPADTTTYTGTAKTFVQADGSFFCRGNIVSDKIPNRVIVRLEGRISRNDQVYAKSLTQFPDSIPLIYLGSITDSKIVMESPTAPNTKENFSILLK